MNGADDETGDHLIPTPGVLFEPTYLLPKSLAFRKALIVDFPREEGLPLIQIATSSDATLPLFDLIVLLKEGEPHSTDPAKYVLIYNRWTKDGGPAVQITPHRINLETRLADRMLAVWRSLLLETRYRRKPRTMQAYNSEYHYLYTLGEGTMVGAAPEVVDADQPLLLSLREAVIGLRIWIRSDGRDATSRDRWFKALGNLEDILKQRQ